MADAREKLNCRRCKEPSVPAPGTTSRDGKACLCGDCDRATRHPPAGPDPSYFGVTNAPSLEISSELEGGRTYEFDAHAARRYAHRYIKHLIEVEGKNESDAKREAFAEVGRLLGGLNRHTADSVARADEVAGRLWLEQWRDSLDMAGMFLPEMPRYTAADKSASTRKTRLAMALMQSDAHAGIAHIGWLQALHDALSSRELCLVFLPYERDLLLAWMGCSFLRQRRRTSGAHLPKLDRIVASYRAWYGWRLSRSKIRILLNSANSNSLFRRIRRRWRELQRNGAVSPELSDAVYALLEQDEPELTDVQEVNPRTFRATGGDDEDTFPLAVRAYPWFCWHHSITARNIIDAYGGFQLSLCPDSSRNEGFNWRMRPAKSPRAERERERIEEFGRSPAMLDRLCKPLCLTLSYSQSGRGFTSWLKDQRDTRFAAMRSHAENPKEYVRLDSYTSLRPCDQDEAKEDVDD